MLKVRNKEVIASLDDFKKMIDPYTEFVLIAPWNGKPVPVTIRMLDSVTINACGDFNTVNAVIAEDSEEKITTEVILKTKNIHENILRYALVNPTFDELQEHMESKNFFTNAKAKIEATKKLVNDLVSMEERAKYNEQIEILEMSIAFLLPEDFTATIVQVVLQNDVTDINKLNRDTLLRVGLLAEKYNVRPSKYLEGQFTEKQNEDIDVSALGIVHEFREMQKVENGNVKWIRGNKKKQG